jgi:hypothetical protein
VTRIPVNSLPSCSSRDSCDHDHEALGALNHADQRGVGIARYIRHAEDPQEQESAA